MQTSRRGFLASNGLLIVAGIGSTLGGTAHGQPCNPAKSGGRWPGFPQQDPSLAKEIVGASHGNIARVRELVGAHPELAKASYDWGFGDWETALGAASHVGNREIAELLLANGARLDIFAAATLGMLDVVKAALVANPALAGNRGPHGISLLAHAEAGKHATIIEFLRTVPAAASPSSPVLSDEQVASYAGKYACVGGPGVIVGKTRLGLAVRADIPSGVDRTLVTTGENTFHPVGAPGVRVWFTVVGGKAERIEITEGEWFVSASRVEG